MGLKPQPESIIRSRKCSFKKEKGVDGFVQLSLKNGQGNSKTSPSPHRKARLPEPRAPSSAVEHEPWRGWHQRWAPAASACPGPACSSAGTHARCPPGPGRAAGQRGASSSGLCTWSWRRAGSPSSRSSGRSPYSLHRNELSSSLSRMGELQVL